MAINQVEKRTRNCIFASRQNMSSLLIEKSSFLRRMKTAHELVIKTLWVTEYIALISSFYTAHKLQL